MRILKELGLVFFFGLLGHVLEYLLPFTMPASVLGLLLMLLALRLRVLRTDHLGDTASYLSANMAFFFLPSAVAIIGEAEALRGVVFPILLICVLSALITFAATYAVSAGLQRVLARRRNRND